MADIKPGEHSWNDIVAGGVDRVEDGHLDDFKEVFDFTRESVCMSDPEVIYVSKITCDGDDITQRCIYANKYYGIVIVAVDPAQLSERDAHEVEFDTLRGTVGIKFDIETCVKANRGRATIILPAF